MNKKKSVKDFIWNAIGVTLNSFLILALLIVITRINGIEISGYFSFAFSFCAIILAITTYGGRNYQVSDVSNKIDENQYLSSKIITSVIGIIVLLLYFVIFKQKNEIVIYVLLLMLIKLIETFSDVFFAIFQKNNQLDIVGKSLSLKNIIGFVVFLIIDIFTNDIIFSIVGMIIINIIIFIIYDYRKVRKITIPTIKINKESILVLKECFYFFMYNFLILVIANISRFTVNGFLSDNALGYYGILIMIPSVMTLLAQFFVTPSIITLATFFKEKDYISFNKTVFKLFITSFIISIICVLCAYFLGEPVLTILYSISFEGYKMIFVEFIIIGFLNSLTWIISNALTIIRRTKWQVYLYLVTLILGIVTSYFLTKFYGFNGAINSYLITMSIQFSMFLIYYIIVIKKERVIK